MSIKKISQLTCDGCGNGRLLTIEDVSTARIEAQRTGWKFMTYQGLNTPPGDAGPRSTPGKRSRQWDACPNCELPAPREVEAIMATERDAPK